MNGQKGFTLVELVIVIVILGILAATAIPRFVDLSDDAEQAAVQGFAGAIGSAMSINYAACSLKNHDATDANCTAVPALACTDVVANSLIVTALPNGYVPSQVAAATAPVSNGSTATCRLTYQGKTADYVAIVAGQP